MRSVVNIFYSIIGMFLAGTSALAQTINPGTPGQLGKYTASQAISGANITTDTSGDLLIGGSYITLDGGTSGTQGLLMQDYPTASPPAAYIREITGTSSQLYLGYSNINQMEFSSAGIMTTASIGIGITPASLYTVCGFPSTCNGTAIGGSTNLQPYSAIYDGMALYFKTSRAYNYGENGLWINFNSVTGYTAPTTSGILDRAGMQISAFAASGGGQTWGQATSITWDNGWNGTNGNFGTVAEFDPTLLASDPLVGSSKSQVYGVWIAGQTGYYPLISLLQLSPITDNGYNWAPSTVFYQNAQAAASGNMYIQTVASCTSGSTAPSGTGSGISDNTCSWNYVSANGGPGVYQAYYGVLAGSNSAKEAVIWDASQAYSSYTDKGTHKGPGIQLQGTYGFSAIQLGAPADWTAISNCGSLVGSAKCITFTDPNGNLMYVPAYGSY